MQDTEQGSQQKHLLIGGGGMYGMTAAYIAVKRAAEEGSKLSVTLMERSKSNILEGGSIGTGRISRSQLAFEDPNFEEYTRRSTELAMKVEAYDPRAIVVLSNNPEDIKKARDAGEANASKVDQKMVFNPGEEAEMAEVGISIDSFTTCGTMDYVVEAGASAEANYRGAGVINPQAYVDGLRAEITRMAQTNENINAEFLHDCEVISQIDANGGVQAKVSHAGEEKTIEGDCMVCAYGAYTENSFPEDHPAVTNTKNKAAPLFYYHAENLSASQKQQLENQPIGLLKIKGGPELAKQFPSFVADHPEFAGSNYQKNAYFMVQPGKEGEKDVKIGLWVPKVEEEGLSVKELIERAKAELADEKHQKLASDFLNNFVPGLKQIIPTLEFGKPDNIACAPICEAPNDIPIIDLYAESSNIAYITGLSGIGGKMPMLAEIAVNLAMGREAEIDCDQKEYFSAKSSAARVATKKVDKKDLAIAGGRFGDRFRPREAGRPSGDFYLG